MSSNTDNSNTSSQNSSSSVDSSNSFTPYTITSRGTNSQGNDYDSRTQPCGDGYHYSNADGSYYYKNGDNSTFHDNGQGTATVCDSQNSYYRSNQVFCFLNADVQAQFTAPNGTVYKRSY